MGNFLRAFFSYPERHEAEDEHNPVLVAQDNENIATTQYYNQQTAALNAVISAQLAE